MHRARRGKAHARAVAFATLATLISTFAWTPASAQHQEPEPSGTYCYLEADKGNFPGDNDYITLVDTGLPNPPGPNEKFIGDTGRFGIEALAMRQSDGQLFAADHDILGQVDEHTGVFTPVSGAPWGPGNGAEGMQDLDDADGLSFRPDDDRLYASIRREPSGNDLLIQVDPNTGALVKNAFGPGIDYVVVSDPLPDVDDITFDANGVLWAITNDGGRGSTLVKINTTDGTTFDRKPISGHPNADDIESLGWADEKGTPTLFGLNGKAVSGAPDNISRLWEINPATGNATLRSQVGEGPNVTGIRDYEGIACAIAAPKPIVDVRPPRALNAAGTFHVFTVRVCVDENGDKQCTYPPDTPISGAQVNTTVTPAEDEVPGSNTCGAGTDANGECFVTVTRDDAGTTTLTATATGTFDGEQFTASDTGIKTWLLMCKCLAEAQSGAPTRLHIKIEVPSGDTDPDTPGNQEGLNNAVVTDNLPADYIFEGATPMDGAAPGGTATPGNANGTVEWRFAHMAPGIYEADIFVSLVPGLADGTEVTNVLTVEAEGFAGKATTTHTAVVINDVHTRAYGLRADLLGGGILPGNPDIGPTPDSNVQNPDELIAVPNPLPGATDPLVRVLTVEEADTSNANQASGWAESKVVEADINIPGVVRVQADAVVARAESSASATSASSTANGSTIGNLRINGTQYGDVSEPLTVVINDPLNPGTPFVEVHVLERITSGAAAGTQQPELYNGGPGRVSRSGIIVNGIHVVVHNLAATPINETSDIQVAHAEAFATFGPAVDCRTGPQLSGDAHMVSLFNVRPDLAHAIVGEVTLPVTGGHEEEHLADIDLPAPLGTVDAATTRVTGSRTLGAAMDGSQDTAESHALAQVAEAHLVSNNINARAVEAKADCGLAGNMTTCTGETTIADVVIGGTNVCTTLGLASTCKPAPNTNVSLPAVGVLLRLNEQIPEPNGLTVNAIHIFVVGEGNPLGLPVGAEIIISHAHADAHPSVLLNGC